MKAGYIEPEAVRALQNAILNAPRPRKQAWLPFALALSTGLRIGDIVALPAGALVGCRLTYTASKTGKQGSADIPPELAEALRSCGNSRWLFPSPYRGGAQHLTRQAAWKRIKTAAKRAELPADGISPHSMRKVFAVDLCARQGLGAVQRALQHSRVDVTELYALSDYLSAGNASKPLTRADVPRILQLAVDAVRASLSRNA